MMPTDRQTNLAIRFEAATRGQEAEGWRTERVGGREHDAAVVDASGKGGGGGPAEREVPGEEVRVGGGGGVVVGGGGVG